MLLCLSRSVWVLHDNTLLSPGIFLQSALTIICFYATNSVIHIRKTMHRSEVNILFSCRACTTLKHTSSIWVKHLNSLLVSWQVTLKIHQIYVTATTNSTKNPNYCVHACAIYCVAGEVGDTVTPLAFGLLCKSILLKFTIASYVIYSM